MKDAALYLEVDEDITSAIDKLLKTEGSVVQVVVPKRSTMLQSVINQKLLKKAAGDAGKELVLVTNDRVASDLATRVGLAVAPSVGAKPVLNEPAPAAASTGDDVIEDDDPEPTAAELAAAAAAGVGGSKEAAVPAKKAPFFSRREVDAAVVPATVTTAVADGEVQAATEPAAPVTPASAPAVASAPLHPNAKVPDFNVLRQRLAWGALAVVLIVGYFTYMALFSSAKVTLYAAAAKVPVDGSFTVASSGTSNPAGAALVGQEVSVTKDLNGSFTPSGKKDVGTKAGGTITISNCLDNDTHHFVSGTRFQAPDGKLFRSTEDIDVPGGSGNFFGCNKPGTASVPVQADQNGDTYNEAPATYTLPGLPANQQSGNNAIVAKGAQMTGGTTKVVTVVAQSDVDGVRDDLLTKDKDNGDDLLKTKVPSGFRLLTGSIKQSADTITPSPAIDAEGAKGSVAVTVKYVAVAVSDSDFATMVKAAEQKQVGANNQIYDDGLGAVDVTLDDKPANGPAAYRFSTTAYSGAKLDAAVVANQLKGLKYGDAVDTAAKQPGVQKADVSIKPAWNTKVPGSVKRITVSVQVAGEKP